MNPSFRSFLNPKRKRGMFTNSNQKPKRAHTMFIRQHQGWVYPETDKLEMSVSSTFGGNLMALWWMSMKQNLPTYWKKIEILRREALMHEKLFQSIIGLICCRNPFHCRRRPVRTDRRRPSLSTSFKVCDIIAGGSLSTQWNITIAETRLVALESWNSVHCREKSPNG